MRIFFLDKDTGGIGVMAFDTGGHVAFARLDAIVATFIFKCIIKIGSGFVRIEILGSQSCRTAKITIGNLTVNPETVAQLIRTT